MPEVSRAENASETAPLLEIRGAIATITLNRPDVHNRIKASDLVVLMNQFTALNADSNVRVVVLTGTGRSFSSGFDLEDFDGQIETVEDTAFELLTDALEALRPVTVARLNGPVYGGATDLALACDFRLATPECRMFMPAARLGLHYYGHGLRRWVARLGLQEARRLFLTAAEIGATDMLSVGYLDAIVPSERLDEEVGKWCDRLLKMAPLAIEGMADLE